MTAGTEGELEVPASEPAAARPHVARLAHIWRDIDKCHVASAVIATPPPARKVPDLVERTKQMTG